MNYAFKNNELLLKSELSISIDDRSFRFGDGCFETIPFKNKKCLYLDRHIGRLNNTLNALLINLDTTPITALISKLILKNEQNEGIIRIICSRGSGSRGYAPENAKPYFIITSESNNLPKLRTERLWKSDQIIDINASQLKLGKINSSIIYVLSKMEAEENNCGEALLIDSNNHICECSSSNIFFRNRNTLIFPKNIGTFIPGVTESVVKEYLDFEIRNTTIRTEELDSYDHAYICNSIIGINSISSISPLNVAYKVDDNDPVISEYQKHITSYFED